jgi:hypothetical protein
MAIHTPAVHPHRARQFPNVVPAVLALVLMAVLAAALLLIQPAATTSESGVWMTEQRHGEIDAGRSGPHPGYLIQRAGEINAANE